jgi:hypothetical protein
VTNVSVEFTKLGEWASALTIMAHALCAVCLELDGIMVMVPFSTFRPDLVELRVDLVEPRGAYLGLRNMRIHMCRTEKRIHMSCSVLLYFFSVCGVFK